MPGPLHSLFAVQSRRPAWALGARMATIVVVPLMVGLITDELGYGLIATLAALNVGIADPGGADRLRARALMAATIAEAVMLALGTLVGADWWVAVPVMFVVALAGGMAGAYGEVVGNVAFFSVVMFIIGVGLAGDAADALDRLWLVALGGAWAMLLCLALWPLRPLRPAQLALAAAFESIAAYLDRFPALALGGLRPRPGATPLGAAQSRAKLDAARGTLELVEGTASGARPAARVLGELTADGEALLRRAEALGEQVARLSLQRAQALRGRTAGAIEAVAADVRAVGALLAHARRVRPDRQALERTLEELDAAIVDERARVAAGADDIRAIVAFRGVELTRRECAALLDKAVGLAGRAASARRDRATIGRRERLHRSPCRTPGSPSCAPSSVPIRCCCATASASRSRWRAGWPSPRCWTSSAASGSTSRSRSSCARTSSRRSSAVCSGWSGRCSAVWEAVAANRRLYLATVDEIAAGLRDAIDAIADGHSAAPDPLERALTGLRADVLALAERRTHELRASTELTPTAATLRRQALVLAQFDACGAALHRLGSAVRELSPSAA